MAQLSVMQPDGCTLLDHLQAAARNGNVDPRLDEHPVPPTCMELYRVFLKLTNSKNHAGGGTITFQEMRAWCELHNVTLNSWEIDTIMEMDVKATKTMAAMRKK